MLHETIQVGNATTTTTTTDAADTNVAAPSRFMTGDGNAQALAAKGFHVFPLSPGSKVPPKGSNGFKGASNDQTVIAAMNWGPHSGVGVATGHDGLLVFDLDTDKNWREAGRTVPTDIFASQAGAKMSILLGDRRVKRARWMMTPTGGAHFYVRVTGIPVGASVKSQTDVLNTKGIDGVGLDTRASGGYVVAYDGGANAELAVHDLPMLDWQELVEAGIVKDPLVGGHASQPSQAVLTGHSAPLGGLTIPERPDRVCEALTALIAGVAPEIKSGRDWWRDNILFPLATAVRKGELTEAAAYKLFKDASGAAGGDTSHNEKQWAATIATPLTGMERGLGSLYHAASAAGWVEGGALALSGADISGGLVAGGAGQTGSGVALALPDTGGKKNPRGVTLANLVDALANAKIGCSFNQRADAFEVCLPESLHWSGRRGECEPFDSNTVLQLRCQLSANGAEVPKNLMEDALKSLGGQNHYDPVKDYFEAVRGTWDGVGRIGTWLTAYGGADDNPFVSGAGIHFLVGAVKRTLQPGAKHDEVLALIGGQGAGKSTLGRVLSTIGGKAYFSDADVLGCEAREVLERTSDSLIHEFGEVKLTGKDGSKVKDLLSRQSDKGRRAFADVVVDTPRRFVFLATGNNAEFLTDVTGNRRWHVVEVCTQLNAKGQAGIDLIGLAADRDQLWAEAVDEYYRRCNIGQLGFDCALYQAAAAAAAKARVTDPWEETLPQIAYGTPGRWLDLPNDPPVKGTMGVFTPVMFAGSTEVLRQITGGQPGGDSRANAMRLAKVATAIGWVRTKRRVSGGPVQGFLVPPDGAFDGGEGAPP